jgi:hypothetical protein
LRVCGVSVRSRRYRRAINVSIDTQCCSLGEDVADFRFELAVERRATALELVGLRNLNF